MNVLPEYIRWVDSLFDKSLSEEEQQKINDDLAEAFVKNGSLRMPPPPTPEKDTQSDH